MPITVGVPNRTKVFHYSRIWVVLKYFATCWSGWNGPILGHIPFRTAFKNWRNVGYFQVVGTIIDKKWFILYITWRYISMGWDQRFNTRGDMQSGPEALHWSVLSSNALGIEFNPSHGGILINSRVHIVWFLSEKNWLKNIRGCGLLQVSRHRRPFMQ